jgi:hypothetical protein
VNHNTTLRKRDIPFISNTWALSQISCPPNVDWSDPSFGHITTPPDTFHYIMDPSFGEGQTIYEADQGLVYHEVRKFPHGQCAQLSNVGLT